MRRRLGSESGKWPRRSRKVIWTRTTSVASSRACNYSTLPIRVLFWFPSHQRPCFVQHGNLFLVNFGQTATTQILVWTRKTDYINRWSALSFLFYITRNRVEGK